jgi:hypothetical protein
MLQLPSRLQSLLNAEEVKPEEVLCESSRWAAR